MPKKYDAEFKARAVRMVREHQQDYPSLTVACQQIGQQLAQTVQRGDHQRVALMESGHRFVENRTGRAASRHSKVRVDVIAPHAGGQQVMYLTVGVLLPRRDPGVPDQLPHAHLTCLATNVEYQILAAWIKHKDARHPEPRNHAGANFPDETSRIPWIERRGLVHR